MNLRSGVCDLCRKTTKTVVPPPAKYIHLLQELLKELDGANFSNATSRINVCIVCLCDVHDTYTHAKKIKDLSDATDSCCLCSNDNDNNLVLASGWSHLDTLLLNINASKRRKYTICIYCVAYLEKLEQIKTNFFKKYPNLKLGAAETPKSKKLESATTKQRKNSINLNKMLQHLKPVKDLPFDIQMGQRDVKLYKQIVYVSLANINLIKLQSKLNAKRLHKSKMNSSGRGSGAKQSFFKIKLKPSVQKIKSVKSPFKKQTKNTTKDSSVSPTQKQLIVKIIKEDLEEKLNIFEGTFEEEEDEEEEEAPLLRTPTKASKKMLPADQSGSKKRKSVTFAEDLNTPDDGNVKRTSMDGSPLKSLLKKYLKNGDTDCFETEEDAAKDSDEETDPSKSYVKDIQENNDDIFNQLKENTNSETKKRKRSDGDSEDDQSEVKRPKLQNGFNNEKGDSEEFESSLNGSEVATTNATDEENESAETNPCDTDEVLDAEVEQVMANDKCSDDSLLGLDSDANDSINKCEDGEKAASESPKIASSTSEDNVFLTDDDDGKEAGVADAVENGNVLSQESNADSLVTMDSSSSVWVSVNSESVED